MITPEIMQYEMVFCDINGTLIDSTNCISLGTSKSGAVEYLYKAYNIPIEANISFGDNFNDVDMLLATGICFAMGNAPAEVKRLVKNVTLDNDHEGVLAGLRQLNF